MPGVQACIQQQLLVLDIVKNQNQIMDGSQYLQKASFQEHAVQQLEQLIAEASTFQNHSLILFGKTIISPYDLASNGFINKNYQHQDKNNLSTFQQLTCICRVSQCSKTLKFNTLQNEKYENQNDQGQIQQILTQHQENCTFFQKPFRRLKISQFFDLGHHFYNKIKKSFEKDVSLTVQKLKIRWDLIEEHILIQKQQKSKLTILVHIYKRLDNKFSITNKRFDSSILLSLFGWKLQDVKKMTSVLLKCHFCSKKVQKQIDQGFDFYNQHALWCLIRKQNYQLWKLLLKKKYLSQTNQLELDQKTRELVLPKTKTEIELKQIREQIFQSVKPALDKINSLLQESFSRLSKQRNFENEFKKRRALQLQEQPENYFQKYRKLDEIAKNCQQLVRNFINSIEIKKV